MMQVIYIPTTDGILVKDATHTNPEPMMLSKDAEHHTGVAPAPGQNLCTTCWIQTQLLCSSSLAHIQAVRAPSDSSNQACLASSVSTPHANASLMAAAVNQAMRIAPRRSAPSLAAYQPDWALCLMDCRGPGRAGVSTSAACRQKHTSSQMS